LYAVVGLLTVDFHLFLDKANERCSFNFNRLPTTIIQGYDEMEKVALAQIVRRLLFKVCSSQATARAYAWTTNLKLKKSKISKISKLDDKKDHFQSIN
jgi:hypothetical protein